jgi:hypothetical protein
MTDYDLWPDPPDKPDGEPTQQDIDAAVAHLRRMAEEAKGLDTKKCVWGEPMLWMEFERALIPGHIYSYPGMDESKISGCCEYHFDRAFQPGWTDIVTGEPGLMPAEESE